MKLRGKHVTLLFRSLAFEGVWKGDTITVGRKGTYQNGRVPWKTTERIVLTQQPVDLGGGRQTLLWRGTYAYEECDTSGKQGCPGRCRIDARIQLDP